MSDKVRYEWSGFRRRWWGPVHVVVRMNSIEATVGDATVTLDLTDRRPADERRDRPMPAPFREGVPVDLDGQHVGIIKNEPGSPLGLFFRRARKNVTGDESFVPSGMRFTLRGLPVFLTLRTDAGALVSTRRWGAPLDDFTWHYSLPGRFGVVSPRVARGTRPEHVAFWFAMRESVR